MPTPNRGESEKDYVARCIPIVIKDGTAKDGRQASAVCHSMYKDHKKKQAESGLPDNFFILNIWDSYASWVEFEAAQGRQSTKVQTLIFNKSKFPTRESAKNWAKEHGFLTETIRETTNSWRIRQRTDTEFKSVSFKTIQMTEGVSAVIGHLQ